MPNAIRYIMRNEEGKYLVEHRPDFPCGAGYQFPGGRVETNESPREAFSRELREELQGMVWPVAYTELPLAMCGKWQVRGFYVEYWRGVVPPFTDVGTELEWKDLSELTDTDCTAQQMILQTLQNTTLYHPSLTEEVV